MENEKKIGRNKYAYLKSISNLTELEKKQVEDFETDRGLLPEQKQKIAKYFESLDNKPELPPFAPVDLSYIYSWFCYEYELTNGRKFKPESNESEAKLLAYTLIAYFFKHDKFLKSPLINHSYNEVTLKKGLLIIGSYGVGKTSIIKTLRQMLFKASGSDPKKVLDESGNVQPITIYRALFGFVTANDLVSEYENISTSAEKTDYWNKYTKGTKYIDDLLTEREASNYGKVNIFKELLEKRSITKAKTIVSLNYTGDYNTNETLEEIGQRYGARVYDRIFEMFSIIELKGKSLRN